MKKILYLLIGICLCTAIISCHNHDHSDHDHDEHAHHDHDHEEEYPSTFSTIRTSNVELFVDYPVLAVGMASKFAAHFTSMRTFKPIKSGRVKVELIQHGASTESVEVQSPKSPGLFVPELTPQKAGNFDLVFYINNEFLNDTLLIKNVVVYDSENNAIHTFQPEKEKDEVAFTKEQSWKVDFATAPVKIESVQNIIQTSGEVLPIESDESSVSATTSGIVTFKNSNLIEGQTLRKNTPLFVVNNDQVVSGNLSEKYAIRKANVDQSKKSLERSRELLEKGIISQKEYDSRNRQYEIDRAGYETLSKNFSSGGTTLNAPMTGILKKLHVVNGQYVNEGQAIASLSSNRHLLIEAEVSQQYFKEIPKIISANIKLPWMENVVDIKQYNGKLIANATTAKDHYIPVLFKIENKGDIIPGTFLDVYLKTTESAQELVIPKTALLREYDLYFVYVMTGGESFEKRNVTVGIDDGNKVQVLSGLAENEWVVTKGVYAVKMASMSTAVPSHGHAH